MIDFGAVAADVPVGPDQYRHVVTDAWWMAIHRTIDSSQCFGYMAQVVEQVWIPADQRRDWALDRRVTGRREWVLGSAEEAAEAGFEVGDRWPVGRWQAPYGDFFATEQGRSPGVRVAGWQTPTPEFIADLPREPDLLLERLRKDSPGDRRGYVGAFVYAADVLRSGTVPADLRVALYRALLMLPGARITETLGLGSGRDLCISIDDGIRLNEIFISARDAQFAGERDTLVCDDSRGLKTGTVTTCTVVKTFMVDEIG